MTVAQKVVYSYGWLGTFTCYTALSYGDKCTEQLRRVEGQVYGARSTLRRLKGSFHWIEVQPKVYSFHVLMLQIEALNVIHKFESIDLSTDNCNTTKCM